MSLSVHDYANQDSESESISDISRYISNHSEVAPIDKFLSSTREIVLYARPEELETHKFLGKSLFLLLISEAECYFRSIMSFCISVCPISTEKCVEKNVSLGGALWYKDSNLYKAAFENHSLASVKELKKLSNEYIGFSLNNDKFNLPLIQYEKICQLRHGIVHNGGILPAKNAIKLEISNHAGIKSISIGYRELQEILAVLRSIISVYNRELFSEMTRRWRLGWRERNDWDNELQEELFQLIWNSFHSKEDLPFNTNSSVINQESCKEKIESMYGD